MKKLHKKLNLYWYYSFLVENFDNNTLAVRKVLYHTIALCIKFYDYATCKNGIVISATGYGNDTYIDLKNTVGWLHIKVI